MTVLAAVRQNGDALCFVKSHPAGVVAALAAVRQCGDALFYIPEHLRTEELTLAAVQQNGNSLRYVLAPHRTEKLSLAAVRQTYKALRWASKTPAVCKAAAMAELLTAVQPCGWHCYTVFLSVGFKTEYRRLLK